MSSALEEAWKSVHEAPRNVASRRALAEALEAVGDPGFTRLLLDRGANVSLRDPGYTNNLAAFVASNRGKKVTAKKKTK